MPCFAPLKAWRAKDGKIQLDRAPPEATDFQIACNKCIGCAMATARNWTLRNNLELHRSESAIVATLTYNDDNLPLTLSRHDLSNGIKRIRADRSRRSKTARPLRFFASGEYGEKRGRPHYHALLYGAQLSESDRLEKSWGLGHVHVEPVTPEAVAYVAGYVAKKLIDARLEKAHDVIDYDTGELLYTYQPPFIQMSRRPGIGGEARQYKHSWRSYAVLDGQKIPVPRFLHEAWKTTATQEEKDQLNLEKQQNALRRELPKNFQDYMRHLKAAAETALAKRALKADKRHYE